MSTALDDDAAYDQRVGAAIKAFRVAREMTQADLAETLTMRYGMSMRQQTIVKIESGSRPLRLKEGELIAQALGITLDVLTAKTHEAEDIARVLNRVNVVYGAADQFCEALDRLRDQIDTLRLIVGGARDRSADLPNEVAAAVDELLDEAFVPNLLQRALRRE